MGVALAFDAAGAEAGFLLARIAFGFVIGFFGLNHFLNAETMVGYADAKGVPAAGLAVPFTGGMLLFAGAGIALGVLPAVAAGAVVVFLAVTTPLMHDFWAVPDEQKQDELINFMKNVALLGAAVAFLAVSGAEWPFAVSL